VATIILIILIAAVVWVGSLYLHPFAHCLKCLGSGKNRGSKTKGRGRYGQCRRCKGTGRRNRIGAKTVHRGRVSLAERKRRK
jgi:hypothetical protein